LFQIENLNTNKREEKTTRKRSFFLKKQKRYPQKNPKKDKGEREE
jgi:hypothetical protein